MFSKSFVAIAMLGFVFTATAFGQKEIVIWNAAKGGKQTNHKANIKSPRDVATGQVMDAGPVLGDDVRQSPQTNAQQRIVKKPKPGNLIDTSTGEIVWAKANTSQSSSATAQRKRKQQSFDKGYLSPGAKARKRQR